jgi:hypothetical protein
MENEKFNDNLEIIGDILEEIKEIREIIAPYTQEDATRDFCIDPKD